MKDINKKWNRNYNDKLLLIMAMLT